MRQNRFASSKNHFCSGKNHFCSSKTEICPSQNEPLAGFFVKKSGFWAGFWRKSIFHPGKTYDYG